MADVVHPRNAALLRRVREAEGADGRLPLPDVASWDVFPFEGELQVKRLDEPVVPEPLRHGEGGRLCGSCEDGLGFAIWADTRWKLVAPAPSAVPMVMLSPILHLDMHELDLSRAEELGFLSWRVDAALRSLGGVARVHMDKWGDGGAHLHVWFFARPEGFLQMRGSSMSDWTDCLPPMPVPEWDETLDAIAASMATMGGRSLR